MNHSSKTSTPAASHQWNAGTTLELAHLPFAALAESRQGNIVHDGVGLDAQPSGATEHIHSLHQNDTPVTMPLNGPCSTMSLSMHPRCSGSIQYHPDRLATKHTANRMVKLCSCSRWACRHRMLVVTRAEHIMGGKPLSHELTEEHLSRIPAPLQTPSPCGTLAAIAEVREQQIPHM